MTTRPDGPTLRLGTRGSALALVQAGLVADALRALGATIEMVVIRTEGDDRPLDTAWGEGAFVRPIVARPPRRPRRPRRPLRQGRPHRRAPAPRDRRLPGPRGPPRRARLPRARDHARDAARRRASSAPTARAGSRSCGRIGRTSSTHPLHGNVDTRLAKLDRGDSDALVLAVAGLTRLGLADRIATSFRPTSPAAPPARARWPSRSGPTTRRRAPCRAASTTPRPGPRSRPSGRCLRATGGGCRSPIGALAGSTATTITIRGAAAAEGSVPAGDAPADRGRRWRPGRPSRRATDAALPAAARRPGRAARPGGRPAGARGRRSPRPWPPSWRPPRPATRRDQRTASGTARAPARASWSPASPGGPVRSGRRPAPRAASTPSIVPAIEMRPAAPGGAAGRGGRRPRAGDAWVVVTSATGADAVALAAARVGASLRSGTRVAAVGAATAEAVARAWRPGLVRPDRATGATARRRAARSRPGDRGPAGPRRHRRRGPPGPPAGRGAPTSTTSSPTRRSRRRRRPGVPSRAADRRAGVDVIVLTSGSTVRGLLALLAAERNGGGPPAQPVCLHRALDRRRRPRGGLRPRRRGPSRSPSAPSPTSSPLPRAPSPACRLPLQPAAAGPRQPCPRGIPMTSLLDPTRERPAATRQARTLPPRPRSRCRPPAIACAGPAAPDPARVRARDPAPPGQLVAPLFVVPGPRRPRARRLHARPLRVTPDEALADARAPRRPRRRRRHPVRPAGRQGRRRHRRLDRGRRSSRRRCAASATRTSTSC